MSLTPEQLENLKCGDSDAWNHIKEQTDELERLQTKADEHEQCCRDFDIKLSTYKVALETADVTQTAVVMDAKLIGDHGTKRWTVTYKPMVALEAALAVVRKALGK
jgi:hypothetical protein